MINKTINGYKIKHLLGTGGMAEVYFGENSLEMPAAIKVLKKKYNEEPTVHDRFVNEAKIMKSLDHTHIRKVMDLGELDGQAAIVMEYLEGKTLKEHMEGKQKLDESRLRKYFDQCAQALAYTHQKGISHRDIKPSNIFITTDDQVKLVDFGIAKSDMRISHTATGQTLGTVMYMSPEQVVDPKRVTTKTDIYSLGVTFYHALTGKPPYDYKTGSEFTIQKKIVEDPLDLSQVSASWQSTLSACLKKDPQERMLASGATDDTIVDTSTLNPTSPPKANAKPSYLPYIIGVVGIIIALLGMRQCGAFLKRPSINMITIPSRNLKLSETEVTIGQYLAFCKATDSHWPKWLEKGSDYNVKTGQDKKFSEIGMSETNEDFPITGVSALDAEAFCQWMDGRLPTEEEWQYAARGGEEYLFSGSDNIDAIAWYSDNSGDKLHPVKRKKPNGYGLYDMSGNVWEWTRSKNGFNRVQCGGAWDRDAERCQISSQNVEEPNAKNYALGFRMAKGG